MTVFCGVIPTLKAIQTGIISELKMEKMSGEFASISAICPKLEIFTQKE